MTDEPDDEEYARHDGYLHIDECLSPKDLANKIEDIYGLRHHSASRLASLLWDKKEKMQYGAEQRQEEFYFHPERKGIPRTIVIFKTEKWNIKGIISTRFVQRDVKGRFIKWRK